jgi:hypothetical protein
MSLGYGSNVVETDDMFFVRVTVTEGLKSKYFWTSRKSIPKSFQYKYI